MSDDAARPVDMDPVETGEWLDALTSVFDREGPQRGHFLIEQLINHARRSGVYIPYSANTAYLNTIPAALEIPSPGDAEIEWRLRSVAMT